MISRVTDTAIEIVANSHEEMFFFKNILLTYFHSYERLKWTLRRALLAYRVTHGTIITISELLCLSHRNPKVTPI